ncbi:hypothetical protein D3C73_1027680 [compost metagenome]
MFQGVVNIAGFCIFIGRSSNILNAELRGHRLDLIRLPVIENVRIMQAIDIARSRRGRTDLFNRLTIDGNKNVHLYWFVVDVHLNCSSDSGFAFF